MKETWSKMEMELRKQDKWENSWRTDGGCCWAGMNCTWNILPQVVS